MVKENPTQSVKKKGKQVVVSEIAHEALTQIVEKRAARGINTNMGIVLSELIIKENENS